MTPSFDQRMTVTSVQASASGESRVESITMSLGHVTDGYGVGIFVGFAVGMFVGTGDGGLDGDAVGIIVGISEG